MGSLIGFRSLGTVKAKKSGGGAAATFSTSEMVRLRKAQALARTQTGEFSSEYELNSLIDDLKKLPPDPKDPSADIEIANTQAELRKLQARKGEVDDGKSKFDEDLKLQLREQLSTPDGQLPGMQTILSKYADGYDQAAQYYKENVLKRAYASYGTSEKIPQNVIDYGQELDKKASMYREIFNATVPGPDGTFGKIPNAGGFVPQLNAAGEIVGVDILTQEELKSRPDLLLTDTPTSLREGGPTIPLYLPTTNQDDGSGNIVRTANFGGITYKQEPLTDSSPKLGLVMKAQIADADNPGWFTGDNEKIQATNSMIEEAKAGKGMVLSGNPNFKIGSKGTDPGTVSYSRGHIFYTDDAGKVTEADGITTAERLDNMSTWLRNMGKDPNALIGRDPNAATGGSKVRLAGPDIFDTVNAEDAKLRGDSLSPPSPDSYGPQQRFTTTSTAGKSLSPEASAPQGNFFAGNRPAVSGGPSAPNKPEAPKESVAGKSWVGDIVAKGAKYFSSLAK